MEQDLQNEHLIMTEWNKKITVTEEILTMDEEILAYAEAPVELDDYDEYLSKFEVSYHALYGLIWSYVLFFISAIHI